MEKIFVYVTTAIVSKGEQDFVERHLNTDQKEQSQKDLYKGFLEVID